MSMTQCLRIPKAIYITGHLMTIPDDTVFSLYLDDNAVEELTKMSVDLDAYFDDRRSRHMDTIEEVSFRFLRDLLPYVEERNPIINKIAHASWRVAADRDLPGIFLVITWLEQYDDHYELSNERTCISIPKG